ncbi:carbonic anhydrase [Kocuria turfanensis]|uniref:carbonic anhydrase n=2 Tax=Kocuria turfanensis TaxID=388357 RepID=A0A512IFA9_9MICC|nr:carbonic anhydrase family protein [Kocuria turfanensis]GEO96385.1 carbonic anhydrase [Kocuria turfanensis]
MHNTSLITRRSVITGSGVGLLAMITGCTNTAGPDDPATASPPQGGASGEWSYEGASGPQHWGELDDEFTTCSTGTAQSPIDVPSNAPLSSSPTTLDYTVADFQARDTGHTVELHALSPQRITVDGTQYTFKQMHYHAPSEHTVGGTSYEAEFHFVHQSDDDALAVIGVLATAGKDNAAWSPVIDAVPATRGGNSPEVTGLTLTSLLPDSLGHYAYDGSLTTPPCSEGVRWLLLQTPIELSTGQIEDLRSVHSGNNRPTRPLNNRKISQTGQ